MHGMPVLSQIVPDRGLPEERDIILSMLATGLPGVGK